MSCLYDQAKETNHLWGAVVVAALVGLVILWRKDKLHMSCLKWRSRSAVRYVHIELLFLYNYDSYFVRSTQYHIVCFGNNMQSISFHT